MLIEHAYTKPDLWKLFRIWAVIGLQSFGGGASTIFLIRRTFIEKHDWVTEREMSNFWNLCIFTPGINLIALTILIGRKLGGVKGIAVSLMGFLLPSATITCLLAAGFKLVQNVPAVQAILHGVIPATAGVMFLVALSFARPLVVTVYKEGIVKLLISTGIVAACAIAVIVLKLSVVVVVLGAALLGIVFFTPRRITEDKEE